MARGEYQVDMVIYPFEYNLDHYVFDSVDFQPLDDPRLNPAAADAMQKGETMNGHLYVPNVKPEMVCSVKFRSKDGKSRTGTTAPVGVAPDGSVKYALMKRAQ